MTLWLFLITNIFYTDIQILSRKSIQILSIFNKIKDKWWLEKFTS